MVKPYSMDLRERVVAAVTRDGLSRHEAARRFGVAPSTSINWVKRLEQTGEFAAVQSGGRRAKKITGLHEDWLRRRCREAAFTLRGLVKELAERGLQVSYRVVWKFVHAEQLSHKKNSARRRAGPPGRGQAARPVDKIPGPG
jgi:putative transposase